MSDTIGAVMPAYNHAEYLNEAIDSVVGQVGRLVVVNDGSSDNTRPVLNLRQEDVVVVHHEQNQGTAAAINTGIAKLRELGDFGWLTWVSSDNIMSPVWAHTLLEHADESTGVVYSSWTAFPQQKKFGKEHRITNRHKPGWLGQSHQCYYGPSFLVRHDVWQDHRGLMGHDYDNWTRVEEACWAAGLKIVHVDVSLCRYRMHATQATRYGSRQNGKDAREWLKECKRRRAELGITPPS